MKKITKIEPQPQSNDIKPTLEWLSEFNPTKSALGPWETQQVIIMLIHKVNELTDEVNRMNGFEAGTVKGVESLKPKQNDLTEVQKQDTKNPYYLDLSDSGLYLIKKSGTEERYYAGKDKQAALNLIERLNKAHRPTIKQGLSGEVLVCWNDHSKNEPCDFSVEIGPEKKSGK